MPRIVPSAALLLALSACGGGGDPAGVAQSHVDPLMAEALADQIMVDPDMVNRNTASMVASFPSQGGIVPLPDAGGAAISAARAQAHELVGGASAMRRAPAAERVGGELPPEARLSVAARAAASGEGMADCAGAAEFSAIWAARLPQAFPVYPRGAVQEAAGTDRGGCHLRVVNFTTPVPASEVIDFYYTRGQGADYRMQRILQDGDDILGGTRGEATFMVFVRARSDGSSDVDLVTSGA